MMAHNEVYLRCPQLANASRVLGNLGDDILSKITLKSGVGTIVETGSDDGHFMAVRGPETPALPADSPSRPTAGLVVVLRAVFGSRLILRRSFKKYFIKKPMKQAQPAPRPRGRPPGSKKKPKPPELPLPKSKKMIDDLAKRKKMAHGAGV